VAGDNSVEANETINVTLSSPANATLLQATAVATILNDDVAPPSVAVPTLTSWGMGLLSLGLGFMGWLRLGRKKTV
jgi:hypothetical protein